MDMQSAAKLDIPEGEVRTIHDKNGNLLWGKVSYSVKYKGDTVQNGTPTPSAPVAVRTVTGENVVKISDGQGNEHSYEVNLSDDTLLLPDGTFTNAGVSGVFDKNTIVVSRTGSSSNTSFIRVDLEKPITIHAGDTFTLYAENYQTIGATDDSDAYMSIRLRTSSSDDATTDVYLGKNNASTTITASEDKTYTRFVVRTASSLSPSSFMIKPKLIINGQDKSIELCKIGTYQDYIYKSGGKWYVHKEIGKILSYAGETISTDYISTTGSLTTGATIYYALATPADTIITDTALIAQLEVVEQWLTRYGYNATVSGNLPIVIDRTAL